MGSLTAPSLASHDAPIEYHVPWTPVNLSLLETELDKHPDTHFVNSLCHDMRYGARIGYTGDRSSFIARNLLSALSNPDAVSSYLKTECERNHMAGPYSSPPFPNTRCSGVGIVPKKSGGLRLIMHLSAPEGGSINDGISAEEHSLHYVTVDDAVRLISKHGQGCLMSKVDMKHAFRICPVAPLDWPLLGIFWEGQFYIDKVLPFGLRSSPYLFNRLADAIAWIAEHNFDVVDLLHYLDDFLLVQAPSPNALLKFKTLVAVFDMLNIPLADGEDKVCPPSTQITFLGIELDTVTWEMRLPEAKLVEIRSLLADWLGKATCTKRELLSLAGSLTFAAKVIPPGRTFCRRLFSCASALSGLDTNVAVPEEAKLDVMWWEACIRHWNGRNLLLPPSWHTAQDLGLFTDASGSKGFGMVLGTQWSYGAWTPEESTRTIEWKELFAVLLACITWGPELSDRRVLLYCDNEAVCHVWRTGVSKSSTVMDLVRAGLLWAAQQNTVLLIRHISGHNNVLADALSRMQLTQFRSLHPAANPNPTPPARRALRELMLAPWSSSVKAWQTVRQPRTLPYGERTSNLQD